MGGNITFELHNLAVCKLSNFTTFFWQVKVQSGTLPDLQDLTLTGDTREVDASYHAAIYILLIHIHAAYLCYVFGNCFVKLFATFGCS